MTLLELLHRYCCCCAGADDVVATKLKLNGTVAADGEARNAAYAAYARSVGGAKP